ncbi:AAA family ATPase [Pseudoalteromonas phenolica]|uniref:AAA family ATPase n=1 Tax=Pseudoalteromonas phenolica TaxID=161398 RepID=UPI00110BC2FD|nr:AAA family ATPase [Pseudoalteromonas phenolica]TMO55439.1 cell division protein DamX [Pseudoalteromonas phenolica]
MQSQILPSRAALVDRIAMQFEYGQNLIALVGPSGLGKSYLAETLITEKYPEFNKAYIQVTAQMTDAELMTQLLQNSFRAPLVDQTHSLSENFFQLFQSQPCGPCFWVLDGARHLSDETIEQLRILSAKSPVELFILVTAQAPRMLPNALDIHLERLSLSESKQLMAMFFKDLPMEEDPIFQAFLQESHGNPAVLLDWQASQQSPLRTQQPKKRYRWHLIALTVLLALLLVAFMYQKQIQFYFSEQVEDAEPLTTVLPAKQVLNLDNTDTQTTKTLSQHTVSEVQSLAKATEENDEVPREALVKSPNDSTTDTVSAVLTALETPRPNEGVGVVSPQDNSLSVKGGEGNNVTETITSANHDLEQNEAVSESTELPLMSEPAEQTAETKKHELDLSPTQWLLTQNDSVWAIQLLAVKDKAIANSFVLTNELKDVYVYETVRNGTPWWVVIQAPFVNIDEARNARQQLPKNVLAGQPFYKKFERIKQEIQLVAR